MKTVYIALALGLMICPWTYAQTQECTSLPYSEVCRAVLGMKSVAILTNQVIQFTTKSKLPGVRTEDIRLYIDSRSGRIPIPLTHDGTFSLPIRNDLLEENPRIVSNQPKGTMELKVTLTLNGTLSGERPDEVGDRQRYNSLFFLQDLKTALTKTDFGGIPVSNAVLRTVVAVQLIPKKDAETASVVVESAKGRITVLRDKDGTFRLRRDTQLAEENPWVLMPTNHHWEVMTELQEQPEKDTGTLR